MNLTRNQAGQFFEKQIAKIVRDNDDSNNWTYGSEHLSELLDAIYGPPKGWTIELNLKPIANRNMDWDFSHEACDPSDGPDGLAGHARSVDDALEQIEDIEAEHVYFNSLPPSS